MASKSFKLPSAVAKKRSATAKKSPAVEGLKVLHFAKSGGAVYNDHVRAQPMARLKRLEIGKKNARPVDKMTVRLSSLYTVWLLFRASENRLSGTGQHTPFVFRMFKTITRA